MANLSNINGKFVVEQTTGYVGIGTTDPAFPLEVKFASAELALNATGASIYRLKSDSTDYFRINKNGVGDRLVIAGGGDVGIGISAPTTKLHLGGTAPLDSIIRQDSTASGTNWEIGERAAGKWQIWEDDGDTVVTTFMSTGNVGIGTDSPSTKLHIEGAAAGYLQTIKNTTAGGDYLQMLAETGDAVFQFDSGGTGGEATLNMYRDGTQYVKISADAGVDNYFNNGANVGIGTTSPNIYSLSDATNILSVQATGTNKGGIIDVAASGTGYSGINIGNETIRRGGIYTLNGSDLTFYTNSTNSGTALTERMRIDSSGNVAIGSQTANKLFNLADPAQGGEALKLHFEANSGADKWAIYAYDRTNSHYANMSLGENAIWINGADKRVGIGLTNPSYPLDVTGAIRSSSGIYLNNASGGFLWNKANAHIAFGTSDVERMRIESGGNVRVNFNESGSAGNLYFQDVDNGASMFYIQAANYTGSAPYNVNYINAANSSNIGFIAGGSERMRITSGGNVGIGRTTDTAKKLDVLGTGLRLQDDSSYSSITIGTSGWNQDYPYQRLDTFASDGSGYFWAMGHKKTDGTKTVRMLIADTSTPYVTVINQLSIATFASNELGGSGNYPTFTTNVVFRNNGVSYINGGNVGIGTTSPVARVDSLSDDSLNKSNNGVKTGRMQYSWYMGKSFANSDAYVHIKTNLWMGGSPAGNTEYIMGGFTAKSYAYSANGYGEGSCMFHNWSGGFANLNVTNRGNWATFMQNPYTSTDGYCVIVLRHDYYSTPIIDFQQSFTGYPWRQVSVTATSTSANATGVY